MYLKLSFFVIYSIILIANMYMHARYSLKEALKRFFFNICVKLKFRSKLQVLMDRRSTLLFTDYQLITGF